jgi:uncharacterized phage infection (PIP) family protein YhgE
MTASQPSSWFDEHSQAPLLAEQARKLSSFLGAISDDGQVDIAELEAQEKRVVALMKQVEPLLSPEIHAKVTELLYEVTAFDMMNTLYRAGKVDSRTHGRR